MQRGRSGSRSQRAASPPGDADDPLGAAPTANGDATRLRSRSSSVGAELEKRLRTFRERYPVDDRAFDFLQKSPIEALETILADFKPQKEGQSDYSALLTNFVRQVRARVDRGRKGRELAATNAAAAGSLQDGASAREAARSGRQESNHRDRGSTRERRGSASRERRRAKRRRRVRRRHRAGSSDGSSDADGAASDASSSSSASTPSRPKRRKGGSSSSSTDDSSSSSSSSSSDSGAADEDQVKRVAKARLASAIEDANEEEGRRISMVEVEAARVAADRVAKVVEEATQEMKEKLARYEEKLEAEKQARIEEATRLAEEDHKEQVRRIRQEARDDCARRVQEAEAEADDMLRKVREERAERLKLRAQRRLERQQAKKALKDALAARAARRKEKKRKRKEKERKEKEKKKESKKEKEKEKEKEKARDASSDAGDRKRRRKRRRRTREKGSEDGEASRSRDRGVRGRCRADSWSRDDSRKRRNRDDAASGDRSDSREGRRRGGARGRSRGPGESELQAFRDRYPMDDRAFGDLAAAPGEVRQRVLTQFKPRREGEDDYSALVASFVRAIIARREQQARLNGPPRGRDPADTPRGGRDGRSGNGERSSSPLGNFRMRYPMDDRAFSTLERAAPGVQATVLSDFKPRREGEDDYSALVMTFVRAVQSRVGGGERGGGDRDRDP